MPELKRQSVKLYLQMYVNNNRFALPAKDVIAIVPVVAMHEIPKAPDYLPGILNYHGNSVPVVDVRALLTGTKSNNRLSTRIIIIRFETENESERMIGLLAERLTEVMRVDESNFKNSGVENNEAKYLGDVLTDESGILQRLKISELLPETAKKMLLSRPGN